jgi:coniferyl-aldehyde dehydrogenase
VAPDYALVPQESIQEFVIECKKNFIAMFGGNISKNLTIRRLSMIVIKKEFKRYWQTLKKSAQIIECSAYDVEKDGRRMPVHIVLNCSPQMRIMKEELFGPVLPVVSYDTLDEAIKYIKADERPLALYCFSHSSSELDAILKQTHSGGVTINDWGWHVVNHDAPFGGIGNSGMGTYHGEEGFRELSHAKTVFSRHRFFQHNFLCAVWFLDSKTNHEILLKKATQLYS